MALNFGIIGTGAIADGEHAPALNALSNATLHSVLGRLPEKTEAFARKHGAAKAFTELEAFLDDERLEAVIIASPDNLHADHILACIEAGKHVLVEKPMAVSLEQCALIKNACRFGNVKLAVGYHHRFHAGLRMLHQKICEERTIGELRHMRLHYTFAQKDNSNWRAHDELGTWWSLAATGVHCVDLALWFAGRDNKIKNRSSLINRDIWNGPHDESAAVSLVFENGLSAEIFSSVLFQSPSRFEVYGTDGFAICEGVLGRQGAGSINISGTVLEYTAENPYKAQLQNFIDVIRNDGTSIVNEDTGVAVVHELILATTKT